MTTTEQTLVRSEVRTGNPWRPTWAGVALVTRIELLRRRPTTKGYIFYGVLFAAILALGILVSVVSDDGKTSLPLELVIVLVLGTGMLIGPSLSATSINGDSAEGVLAPLQMARLTAADLAFGKLIAAWAVSIAALITTAPFLVHAFSRSGWTLVELARVLGVILLLVLMATAIGLAWSALMARTIASVSLAHVTTGFMVLGSMLMFAFTTPLIQEDVTVINRELDWDQVTDDQWDDPFFDAYTLPCVEVESIWTVSHTDRTIWMVLINPIVTVAEVSPLVDPETYQTDGRAAPGLFSEIHREVASGRLGALEPASFDGCDAESVYPDPWGERYAEASRMAPNPWPGLAVAAALLVVSMAVAIHRLRVPYRTLRTGSRVA